MRKQVSSVAVRRTAMVVAALAAGAAGVWALQRTDVPSAAQPRVALASAEDPHSGHVMPAPDDDGVIRLPPEMIASLGVTTVAAELAPLTRTIRTTGNVVYDETRLTTITPRYAGFVERLYVDFTGQAVRRGQPMLEIYSPELVAAQEELLTAIRMQAQLGAGAAPAVMARTAELVDAARRRLVQWDVSAAQVAEVERSGRARRTLTLHATSGGFVTENMVQAGQAVEAGMALYRLADLSSVWVEADIYEQDLRFVEAGQVMQVEIAAWPGETLRGRISYVYPEVRLDTRTARIRISLANPGGRVKPGMFATAQLETAVTESAVLVPRDAVMHSGSHAMVFVDEGAGAFRARQVVVGADMGGRTQVLSGLQPGERVVQRANFLLDSESRLMEAPGTMSGMNH